MWCWLGGGGVLIAAPILDNNRKVVAALRVFGPLHPNDGSREQIVCERFDGGM